MIDKFTPAPWTLVRGFDAMYISGVNEKENTAFCNLTGDTWDQAEANAHLIASAPDMLKALETVAQELEDVAEVPQCVYDAIKKARGLK